MLETSPLILGYNNTTVMRIAPLSLCAGEQRVIAAPSGKGKTTLLLTLAGILPPLEGRIQVAGHEMSAMNEAQRDHFRGRHIGIVFQALHLLPALTVEDNVRLTFFAAGMACDEAHLSATLRLLDISDIRQKMPHQLSQGQAQRASIARAVVHNPKLILADEPTSSLDDMNCERVMTLLQTLAREREAALLVSTHDRRIHRYFNRVTPLEEMQK